jgi:Kef-type K+ transport system membrane component KefB
VVVAVVTTLFAARAHPPKVIRLLHRHLQSSAQLPVRVAVLFILGLVYLAFRPGLDVLLGAFAAGIVVRLFVRGETAASSRTSWRPSVLVSWCRSSRIPSGDAHLDEAT